jgi:hypothetical protein
VPADAGVNAKAKTEVPVGRAVGNEFKGTIKGLFVTVAGRKADEEAFTGPDLLAADFIVDRRGPEEVRNRETQRTISSAASGINSPSRCRRAIASGFSIKASRPPAIVALVVS